MCGIVGYTGPQPAAPILLEGLRRLEYRGYDSAGISLHLEDRLLTRRKTGRIDQGLVPLMQELLHEGRTGIGHTRWATHGAPTDENSHPHADNSGRIILVHNGVIENYDALKTRLSREGSTFRSDTDSEVLAELIGRHYTALNAPGEASVLEALREALGEVIGTYGIGLICSDCPGVIFGARRGSPLIIGIGAKEHFLASDTTAILAHTREVVYLNDYDLVTLTPERFHVESLAGEATRVQISRVEHETADAEKGDFPHYMLKEIFEQPRTIANAIRGRMDPDAASSKFGGLNMSASELRAVDRIVIPACGTSWHAGLVGEYLIEELAHIPVEVEYASEFRYRNAPLDTNTLVVVITQSGETADTLAALREAKRRGHKVLAICNVVGSTIAREADGGIYLHAGPEIGVASTKAFTSQVSVLALLAIFMGRLRMLSSNRALTLLKEMEKLPAKVERILQSNDQIAEIARKHAQAEDFFFLGRQYGFPVALEGALKLKEISYIHAEGYPSAEMKHGPIAMIDEKTPNVVLLPDDPLYEKNWSNLQEVQARKAPVIAIATEGRTGLEERVDDVIYIPHTEEPLTPLLSVIPLQLLAYHIAVARGCDVDKPRNLAKSVTVE